MSYTDEEAGKAVDDLTAATVMLNETLMAAGRGPLPLPLRTTPIGPFFTALIKLVRDLTEEMRND
jgi:hypothetical protein